MASIGIGIGIENPKLPSIGIGIEKLILQVLVLGCVLISKGIHSQRCSRSPKETFLTLIVPNKLSKSARTGLACPYMDDFKQLCECYVVKSTLSIGIGIVVLELVLVLKCHFQELVLVLVLTLGQSGV